LARFGYGPMQRVYGPCCKSIGLFAVVAFSQDRTAFAAPTWPPAAVDRHVVRVVNLRSRSGSFRFRGRKCVSGTAPTSRHELTDDPRDESIVCIVPSRDGRGRRKTIFGSTRCRADVLRSDVSHPNLCCGQSLFVLVPHHRPVWIVGAPVL
jgi:hypothetical protein